MPRMTKDLSEINLPGLPDWGHFGVVSYPPGGTCGPRLQESLQFVIIHSGSVVVASDEQSQQLHANEVCVVYPGVTTLFQFDPDRPTRHAWVDLGFSDEAIDWRPIERALPFCLPLTRRMSDIAEAGVSCQFRTRSSGVPVMAHLASAFFYAYADAAASAVNEKPLPESVIRARRYIEKHFAQTMDLADIADAAKVTENHIVRLFRRHLGVTPVRYLWQTRVRRGAELLRSTGLSISEVAYQVGFSTPYHFSRLVKQQLGQSPRDLRQAAWKQ
jgi:AraC family transcriptional regulator